MKQQRIAKRQQAKNRVAKRSEQAFISLGEIFSTLGCGGRLYEPKIPEALKK